MDRATLGWCAGIIDGEGCIRIQTHASRYGVGYAPWFGLTIGVKMIHKPTIERLQSVFAVGVIRPENRKNQRTMWIWRVGGQQAIRVLSLVLPYLVTKHDEAQIGIQFGQLNKRKVFGPKARLPIAVTNARRELLEELQRLKKRDTYSVGGHLWIRDLFSR